jgi:hypothetical protein
VVRIAATEVRPGIFLPLVTIQLVDVPLPDGSLFTLTGLALVDSGADMSIVPAESLATFGVDWNKLSSPIEESKGAGGKLRFRRFDAKLVWEGYSLSDHVALAEPKRLPGPLLGRNDFFVRFNVRFRWFKSPPELEIDPGVVVPSRKKK